MIGTGAFPADNGMVDEYVKVNNRIEKPNANGPAFMVLPTIADLYDRAMHNEPVVGGLATLSAHLMMIGHGSEWNGGDKDIAVAREKEDAATGGDDSAVSWNLTTAMKPFYDMPNYVNDLPPIDRFNAQLDAMDGARDGKWRQNSIAQFNNGFDTPARTPFQTQLFEKVISEEGFGADDVPDLLYLNYKAIDVIGHAFSANGIEMSDALNVQDEHLKILIDFLNRTVGNGKWVLALTADHGTNLDPAVSGAFQIDNTAIENLLNERFDDGDNVPLIDKFRTTEFWLNESELAQGGHDLVDVSNFLLGLTEAQTAKAGKPPLPGHENDPVFAGAFPTSLMPQLPCLKEARAPVVGRPPSCRTHGRMVRIRWTARTVAVGPWSTDVLTAALLLLRVVVVVTVIAGVPHFPSAAATRFHEIAHAAGTPYRDVAVEYPIGELGLIEIVGRWSAGIARALLGLVAFGADLAAFACVLSGWGREAARRYLLLGAPLLVFVYRRSDLVAVALAVAGVVLVRREASRRGGALLGLGVLSKLWPAVLLPILVLMRRTRALWAPPSPSRPGSRGGWRSAASRACARS